MDEDVSVRAAGLEQQDGFVRVLAQPVGEYAAGRPGADDDVIECFHIRSFLFSTQILWGQLPPHDEIGAFLADHDG